MRDRVERIVTSHPGSLPRPEELIDLNRRRSEEALAQGAGLATKRLWQ
jgi:methionine synthase II (cobalamin-independent)